MSFLGGMTLVWGPNTWDPPGTKSPGKSPLALTFTRLLLIETSQSLRTAESGDFYKKPASGFQTVLPGGLLGGLGGWVIRSGLVSVSSLLLFNFRLRFYS